MKGKITKRAIDALTPDERDVFLWDSELKGFGLKVTPAGRKVYLVQFRQPGQSTRRFTIGVHGSPWTPELARTEAMSILGDVARGIDPMAAKRAAKADLTVNELCTLYEAEGGRTKKASTRQQEKTLIRAHIGPLLGRTKLATLSRADIDKFMRDVAEGKTASDSKTKKQGRSIVKGGPSAANRTLGLLAPILEFAVERRLMPANPARGVKKFREKKLTRFLSNDEIARLGDSLRAAEKDGVNSYAIAAVRLLLLTGCRKNEILKLRWEHVDLEGGFLNLPDSKTGAKAVYLGAPAKVVLADIPKIEKNPYVIAGDVEKKHFVGLQKVWERVRAKAELKDVRLHDLRHSFASMGARSGESLLVIGKVLGHSTASATSRYAHLSDDPIKNAASQTSLRIAEALASGDGEKEFG